MIVFFWFFGLVLGGDDRLIPLLRHGAFSGLFTLSRGGQMVGPLFIIGETETQGPARRGRKLSSNGGWGGRGRGYGAIPSLKTACCCGWFLVAKIELRGGHGFQRFADRLAHVH